jgi:nicotinamide-nucleotide amidase
MKAAIITIGDELLIGQTVDTNSAWIGAQMSNAGFDVFRIISVHDRHGDIINVLGEVLGKADVVLITGGLGPTSDDITKPAMCEFFETHLVRDNEVLAMIEGIMRNRKFGMNENNKRQADVPASCRVLKNAVGTAPGMWFEKNGTIYISMPGVPYEMKYLMTEHVIHELNKRFSSQTIIHRNIMTYGTFESRLAEILEDFESGLPSNIKLAYLPASGIIKLRLTATGDNRNFLQKSIDEQVSKLYKIIPEFIYAEDEESLETVIGKLLKESGSTVVTAESCTGGNVAHMITSVAGSSAYFTGSVVAYSNDVKKNILGVPQAVIDENGAVSEATVREMAERARKLFNSDYAVATSGIAGPDGGTESKPAGTLWMAVASAKGTIAEQRLFGNDRNINITRFSLAALNLLRQQIISQ